MSSLTELVATLAPLGVASVTAGTAVWRYITGRIEAADTERRNQIAKLEARLEDREATIVGLGVKRDEDRREADRRVEAERKKTYRVATLMIRRSTVEQIQALDEDEDDDIPTALHQAIVLSKAAIETPELPEAEERRLGRYVAGDPLSTPPAALPRKRPR